MTQFPITLALVPSVTPPKSGRSGKVAFGFLRDAFFYCEYLLITIHSRIGYFLAKSSAPWVFKRKSVKKIWKGEWLKAIEEYEKTRTDSNNAGGSGSANTEGTVAPRCMDVSYKDNLRRHTHSSTGLKVVVGLKRWFEKMEQVFEIANVLKMTK
ncbi:hypothetical protein Tco_1391657 [Tanacetum coccineum]